MKTPKLLLLTVAILAFSCSKDDDPEPSLETAALTIGAGADVITPPAAMSGSSDPYAQMAAAWIESVNGIGQYTTLFTIPDGAAKSTGKITASNGRAAGAGDYVVYTWNDSQTGYSLGLQISEESDHFTWEIFYKLPSDTEWLKYIHTEEKKDKSSGFMKVYDIWGFFGEDPSAIIASYNWVRNGDIFTFDMDSDLFEMQLNITINTKTKAGSVTYYFGGTKAYEMTWDADGDGTWKSYDEQGNIIDEGSWTA
jgi:hypothetical protein